MVRRAWLVAIVGLGFLAVLAAGCGMTHYWIYDKQGMTAESLDRDRGACRTASPPGGLTKLLGSDDVDRDAFTRCMQQRGYTARREIR
jgi:hypothetical protein